MALDPAASAKRALGDWRDELIAGRDDLRPAAAETLHLTLAFLGYRPEKEIATIATALRAALAELPAIELLPTAVVPVPQRRPRLFALDLGDPGAGAAAIQRAVCDALEAGRFYRPEKRPFWPHITLARVKRDRRAQPLASDPPPIDRLPADQVTLYRSTLRPQGALYEPLSEIRLQRL